MPKISAYFLCFSFLASTFGHAQTPNFNNIEYATVPLDAGGTQTLSMDLWLATGEAERAPLVIWIHGGGWQSGTYNNPPPGLQAMLDAGFAVASVQYRLSGAAIFPAQIHDVKGAVRYLRAHADDYSLDASRFAAWGSSAGGHLTTLLATSGGVAELEGTTGGNLEQSSILQTAVDYFGPTDIVNMTLDITTPPGGASHDSPSSAESKLIGFADPGEGIGVLRTNLTNPAAPFPQKAALATLVNPITHIDAADPPIFIAHGDQDTTVPLKQSFRLETALSVQNIDHVMRVVVGAGHGFGTQTATINAEAIAFLSEQLFQPVGDFDRNGAVNGRDFLLWQRQFGSIANPRGSGADGNHDGLVNEADLALWHEHYGEGSDSISALQLPEPSATVLLLFATGGLALRNVRATPPKHRAN
jgi:acetyl esterase/lipase